MTHTLTLTITSLLSVLFMSTTAEEASAATIRLRAAAGINTFTLHQFSVVTYRSASGGRSARRWIVIVGPGRMTF